MGRPPISASDRCPAFPQEGCVASLWANPKRQPLYHKFAVVECCYLWNFPVWQSELDKRMTVGYGIMLAYGGKCENGGGMRLA
jgi:hypothetical protein